MTVEIENKPLWQETILSALNQNKDCEIGLLISKRIFYAKQNNNLEVLIILSTENDKHAFGHIFQLQNKWISFLLGLFEYPVGSSDEKLIENYWHNLNFPWNWDQLAAKDDDCHIRYSNSFEEAAAQMSKLIKNFNKELCIWHKCTGEQKLHDIYWKKVQEIDVLTQLKQGDS